tara:strand:- start:253 stop:438 length:186 start_codon:yes stop_codon:yes gene_type:complete
MAKKDKEEMVEEEAPVEEPTPEPEPEPEPVAEPEEPLGDDVVMTANGPMRKLPDGGLGALD